MSFEDSGEFDLGEMASVRTAKVALRRVITAVLGSLPQESVDMQSRTVVDILLNMQEYKTANRISVFLAMEGKEIQTAAIVRDALRAGKQVFVPYIYKAAQAASGGPSSVMDMLRLHSQQDYESLGPDKWGIPSLAKSSVAERENCFGEMGLSHGQVNHGKEHEDAGLDLIVVPGMAFDRKLQRLGHGKGYYDGFLSRYQEFAEATRGKRMPHLVAVGLDDQILPPGKSVPTDDSDWLVDVLITGHGELLRRGGSA